MNEQQKLYLKNELINDLVKFKEEAERDGYVEDAALLDNAITRLIYLENKIRELASCVK